MRGAKFYIKIAAAVLAVCLLAGGIAYLKWDYDKSRSELIEINKDFLQAQLNRLPLPKEKTESEDMVKQGGFKGIVAYYIGPVDQAEAEGLIRYYQDREESLLGIYTPLEGALTGVFVGEHRYTPVIEALGYGWLSYEGIYMLIITVTIQPVIWEAGRKRKGNPITGTNIPLILSEITRSTI